mmetsp:Transcript_97650/g.252692  ORF Transcript_97650/g.252692 Transcript_97650/m.252692 type:complete len:207 (-) Transcript_97650:172-792(-)
MGQNVGCCERTCGVRHHATSREYDPQADAEGLGELMEERPTVMPAPAAEPAALSLDLYSAEMEKGKTMGNENSALEYRLDASHIVGLAQDDYDLEGKRLDGTCDEHVDANEYMITVDKTSGAGLGIDVHFEGDMLRIDGITNGLLGDWNASHPDEQVQEGDCIVEVNSARGHAGRLVWECRRNQLLELKLRRVPRGADQALEDVAP